MSRPLIGITCDLDKPNQPSGSWSYSSTVEYAAVVTAAGGLPVILPGLIENIPEYLRICGGFLFSGGNDADCRLFGQPLHPKAKLIPPSRQAFETALLKALGAATHPVLGVCLGMQMMALSAGGRLHQHLPEIEGITPEGVATHADGTHQVSLEVAAHPYLIPAGLVQSHHHQAVADAGSLRVVARSADGIIEAVDRGESGRFYLGIQWHPERTQERALGVELIGKFVKACGG